MKTVAVGKVSNCTLEYDQFNQQGDTQRQASDKRALDQNHADIAMTQARLAVFCWPRIAVAKSSIMIV